MSPIVLLRRAALVLLVAIQAWVAYRATVADARFLAGVRAYRAGDFERASDRFDSALRVRDGDAWLWAWAGDSALSLHDVRPPGDAAAARAVLDRAWRGYAGAVLRCPTDAWSWSGLAEVAVRRAKLRDRAEGVSLEVLTRRSQGVLDPDRAIARVAAEVAVVLKPGGFAELDVLASAYEAAGEVPRATEAVVRSARMMPAPSFHTWGRRGRLPRDLYEAILEGLRAGIERAPEFEHSLLHREAGRFAWEQGDPNSALRHLDASLAAARTDYERYEALQHKAQVLEGTGRLEEALGVLQEALRPGIGRAGLVRRLGDVQFRLGRYEGACRDLRESVRDSPGDVGLRIQSARACERAGNAEVAERLLREGFVLTTENPVLARELLSFFERAGRRHTAEQLVRSWIRDFPERSDFQRWAAEIGEASS